MWIRAWTLSGHPLRQACLPPKGKRGPPPLWPELLSGTEAVAGMNPEPQGVLAGSRSRRESRLQTSEVFQTWKYQVYEVASFTSSSYGSRTRPYFLFFFF